MKAKVLGFLFILLSFNQPTTVFSSAWMGCDACFTQGMHLSPMCSSCSGGQTGAPPIWGQPQLPYCPTCGIPPQYPPLATPPLVNYNPWWSQPMAQNYWNLNMPGPYNGWGMNPQYFPQFPKKLQPPLSYMAKPVLYLRGPKGTRVQIKIEDTQKHSELLVMVPSQKNWQGKIHETQIKTDEGNYDFFFYDAMITNSIFQDETGFCGDRESSLAYMEDALSKRNFPNEAIRDFKETWQVKLPHHQKLCIYPQTEKELQNGVKLQFTPASVTLTQLEFIVVPEEFLKSKTAKTWNKFNQAPKKEAQFRAIASTISNSKKQISAFDWGVGFLRVDRESEKKASKD